MVFSSCDLLCTVAKQLSLSIGDVAVEALLAALADSCKYFKNAGTR